MKKKTLILSISGERIITRIEDTICYDEPNLFGVDVNTVRVICGGLNASKLNEGEWKVIPTVKLFDKECPKSVVYDCVRSVIRASITRYGLKPTLYRTCFDAVVCIPKECEEDDLVIIRNVLKDEGAKSVTFTHSTIDEIADKADVNDLGDSEVRIHKSIRPFWKVVMVMFAPWLVYAPACFRYGGWDICFQSWIFLLISAAAVHLFGKRRRMTSRLRNAGVELPEMVDRARIIASLVVAVMVILTLCILCIKGRSHELALAYKATLYTIPTVVILFEKYVIGLIREDCHEIDRQMIINKLSTIKK